MRRFYRHIGVEIAGLEVFCRKLEEQGISFDTTYTELEDVNLAVATFDDSFGATIDLSEGMDGY